jgi:hypothetical protein
MFVQSPRINASFLALLQPFIFRSIAIRVCDSDKMFGPNEMYRTSRRSVAMVPARLMLGDTLRQIITPRASDIVGAVCTLKYVNVCAHCDNLRGWNAVNDVQPIALIVCYAMGDRLH